MKRMKVKASVEIPTTDYMRKTINQIKHFAEEILEEMTYLEKYIYSDELSTDEQTSILEALKASQKSTRAAWMSLDNVEEILDPIFNL